MLVIRLGCVLLLIGIASKPTPLSGVLVTRSFVPLAVTLLSTTSDPTADTPVRDSGKVLTLLGRETTRELLQQLADAPKSIPELEQCTDISRATIYRLIDDLSQTGLITEYYHPTQHHTIVTLSTSQIEILLGEDISVHLK